MPTYNTNDTFLRECLESVLIQSYPHWELCIADDASPNTSVVETIKEYQKKDKRIKLVQRKQNGHISEATNSAIDLANGEYIALLDHDDVLWPNALFEIVKTINSQPEVDFIYTDEDKIDAKSDIHSYPFFKPDWSPEFLESCNYITHFSCIKTSLLKEVGGFRKGYEGAQDWDLFLRVTEKTDKIVHIQKILYSWRIHEDSTAMDTSAKPYVFDAQRKLLEDHISRSGREGVVRQGVIKQHCAIQYDVTGNPSVAILVYGKGGHERAIKMLQRHTSYENKTIASMPDNGSITALNNVIKELDAQYIVLFDATMTIIDNDWLRLLLADAQSVGVGAVGGKTVSRSRDRIMRAGVGMGVYGLCAPLLEFMADDDVHYLRGLYGQSRRNVSAVDGGCTLFSIEALEKIGGFDARVKDLFVVDACQSMNMAGYRTVYNPFMKTIDNYNLTAGEAAKRRSEYAANYFKQKWQDVITNDPYLNPGFSLTNAQLETK